MLPRKMLSSSCLRLILRSFTAYSGNSLHHQQSQSPRPVHPGCLLPATCYSTRTANWDVHYAPMSINTSSSSRAVSFNVGYVDTAFDRSTQQKSAMPVILGMHGCPGTHEDIGEFLKPYAQKGFRVILPNMPSYGITTFADRDARGFKSEAVYRHSPTELAEFVTVFLQELGVRQLQLVVGHSVGCIAPLLLCASCTLPIQGAVFICPFHGHKPPWGMRPYWLVKFGGKYWYKDGIGRRLMFQTYRQLIARRNQVKFSDEEEVGAIIQTGYNMSFDTLPSQAKSMAERQTPLLYAITDADPLVRAEDSLEFAEMLGMRKEEFTQYDSEGHLVKDCAGPKDQDRFVRGVRFASASHTPHRESKIAEALYKEMDRMLQYIQER